MAPPVALPPELSDLERCQLDALPLQLGAINAEGRVMAVNAAWQRFAEEQGPLGGRPPPGACYWDACPAGAAPGIRDVLAGRRAEFRLEYPFPSPTEQRWFELRAAPLDRARPAAGVAVSHEEITERKRMESLRALLAGEERFRRTFENAATGIAITGFDGGLVHANAAFCRMLGYTLAELVGRDVRTLTHPEDQPRNSELLRELSEGRRESFVHEKRYVAKDGRWVWTRVSVALQRDADGRPEGFVGVTEDITAQRGTEERLAHINRLYSVLSAVDACIARRPGRAELLETICRVAVTKGGFRAAAILERDEAARLFSSSAQAGDESDYFVGTHFDPADETRTGGTIGTAVRTGRHDICNDIARDPRMRPWQDEAARRGIHSVATFPLLAGTTVMGVLVLLADSVNYFQADEIDLLLAVQNDLAFALEGARRDEQRQHAEAALAAAQRQQSSILEAVGEGIHGLDAEGRIIFENAAATAMFGHSEEEMLGQDAHTLIHHHCADGSPYLRDRCPIHRTLQDGLTRRVDSEVFFRKDGTPFPVEYVCSAVRGSDGAVIGAVVCFRDVTERRRAEEKLREQAALLDAAHEAILVNDLDGRVVYWNKGAERTYGWTAAEALGRPVAELFGLAAGLWEEQRRQLLERGEWSGELTKRTKDGRSIAVETRWTLVRDGAGQPKSVLAIHADISERKRLEQQFFRAQRLESLGTLAGGIAHDLNNLLAPIAVGVGLLRQSDAGQPWRDIIDSIEQSAKRGANLVKQVLSFARGVEGARVKLDVREILREVETIAASTFPKNIVIAATAPGGLWPVVGDGTQIQQVLLNLCVNARDAMPAGGTLTLTARNLAAEPDGPGPRITIEVADTGSGIPPELMDRIFEPFFTTKEVGKGTGLGLSTALGIVRSHGGCLTVTSTPGKGACFRVTLPAAAEAGAASGEAAGSAAKRSLPRGQGELILLVDDEKPVLTVAAKALQVFGYRITAAGSGAEALRLYAEHRPDIRAVVTDMMMPEMDGAALIAALRQLSPRLPLIAASGLAADDQVQRAAAAGSTHFLPKPYSVEALLKTLRRAIDESAA